MRRGSDEMDIRDNVWDFYKRERNGSSIAKIYHCQPIKHSLTLDFSQPYYTYASKISGGKKHHDKTNKC